MQASTRHQKQKLNLLKSRRLASSITRHNVFVPRKLRKRLSVISIGVVTGLGLPALAFAAQQQFNLEKRPQTFQTHASNISLDSTTSSTPEEVFSSSSDNAQAEQQANDSNQKAQVTINGEAVPLTNGSVSRSFTDDNGSNVDINVTIDNSTSSASNSNTSTDITIDSSSSTQDAQNTTRGSPHR